MNIIALILNILAIPAILLSGVAARISPMMFDAPGSENNSLIKFAFYCLLLLPVVLIITNIFGWVRFVGGDYSGAVFAYKWVLLVLLMFFGSVFMSIKG